MKVWVYNIQTYNILINVQTFLKFSVQKIPERVSILDFDFANTSTNSWYFKQF